MGIIRNISFDLGGVVIALSYEQAVRRFEEIGLRNARSHLDAFHQKGIFGQLEEGAIGPEEFRVELGKLIGREVSMEECFYAWHGYVEAVPKRNLDMLLWLREQGYRVSLLSNTNPFMMQWAESSDFDGEGHALSYYFDRMYLSYQCKVMKPSPEIFRLMLEGEQARPEETLFVDDGQKNVEAAASLGIHTLCSQNNEDWTGMLKKLLLLLMVILLPLTVSAQTLEWGDQGNGTYKNPVLNADYSDPDVIRVGTKYYMVASDFHWTGMQVLESSDLVNWQLISQVYRRFDYPGWDSNAHYAGGSWAPAIRYHDGKYWIYFCTPDEGLFMTTATDPQGPWEPLHCVKRIAKWEDPCPFWDDNGNAYLGRSRHGAGPIIIHKMSADGRQLLDDGVTVYTGPVAEGTKFLKRNGYYYLIIPEGGVGTGWQTVLRSRNIYGPYEKKVVLEQGSTDINGPHQGALVASPGTSEGGENEEWWFLHFQETSPNGRVVHLQPARWKDDWPLVGVDIDGNGIGEPVSVWTKPFPNTTPSLPATSDDFNGPLGLQWQWCHNPVDDHWSMTEHKGFLTLHLLQADSLKQCRSLLTQKVMGYEGEATLLLEASQTAGLRTGLALTGKIFYGIGLSDEGVYTEEGGRYTLLRRCKPKRVWLRVTIDSRHNQHQFQYSLDGKRYEAAGSAFTLRPGYWKGIRVGLYGYTTTDTPATACFDYFKYDVKR